MTYKGPGGFGRIVNILMNIFMCAALSFYVLWVMQQRAGDMAQVLTPPSFVLSFVTAFAVGFTVADLIPVFSAGSAVVRKLNLKGAPAYLVTVAVIAVITTTIISFVMMCLNMIERAGFMGMLMSWIGMYPAMLIGGYVIQLIVMKPAMAFAKNVTGFDPENPTAGMPGAGGHPAGVPQGGPGDAPRDPRGGAR